MQYQTPGVYTIEQSAFPNSVVEVATALPVFIGYTARASSNGKDLGGIPTRVESLKEFEAIFGRGPAQVFTLAAAVPPAKPVAGVVPLAVTPSIIRLNSEAGNAAGYTLTPANNEAPFYLYNAIRLFYLNGGSTCYIVSVGAYADDKGARTVSAAKDFNDAIASLVYEQDPTMVLCPDALRLGQDDYYGVVQQMLMHCEAVQSRVAMFDVYGGALTQPSVLNAPTDNLIDAFRTGVGQNNLKYGVAYFPWVNTTVTASNDITFMSLDAATLTLLKGVLNPANATDPTLEAKVPTLADATVTENIFDHAIELLTYTLPVTATLEEKKNLVANVVSTNNSLLALYPDYAMTLSAAAQYLNTLPVTPAMAGVYTAVDNSRGVWKAPANVSLNSVVSPTLSLSDNDQARLNVDAVSGKSINAIRPFKGLGVLVWGARTLDGNSQDWKYINVRRTMIMIEQSVKLASRAYVFEPNDANTWVTVKSMISSFLFNLWKQGALAGAVPDDAYSVNVGLGSTMTAEDILNGYMNVTILVALVRPAEFILLTFQQQMQKS